jgi:protein-S-isoprenylcysteine O-methyltransferase Ste14
MPPKRLVVTGFYSYVRNPMYVAVTALIAGQGLLVGSVAVLEYGAIVWAGFFLFVVAYEELVLGEQFADEYKRYASGRGVSHHRSSHDARLRPAGVRLFQRPAR